MYGHSSTFPNRAKERPLPLRTADGVTVFDVGLARVHAVETRSLVQPVKQRIGRFSEGFTFQLTEPGVGVSETPDCDLSFWWPTIVLSSRSRSNARPCFSHCIIFIFTFIDSLAVAKTTYEFF